MSGAAGIQRQRRARLTRRLRFLGLCALLVLALCALILSLGQSFTPPATVLRVLGGEAVPGAGFTVLQLRLPRAVVGALAGLSFGMGGAAFQTLLRNPLASPDIIGISAGASAAAVFAITVLGLAGLPVVAVTAGLGIALLIYLLSWRQGVAGARLILVGIGLSGMMQSLTAYMLSQAESWTLQAAMRWMTGSLNGVQLEQALPLLAALVICGGVLLIAAPALEVMRMGDETAAGLGVRTGAVRAAVVVAAVGLVAVATAMVGPVAFVAFLSGPIAARMTGRDGSLLLPAALVGAVLVLTADYAGQFWLPARYPVGIVTGVLGAPYLLFLIIRSNRTGGGL
ncbi:iron ABC transporter permease [Ferrimonas balearica]|nr:iron ABC transporter permease [Ferrimonas balearica]